MLRISTLSTPVIKRGDENVVSFVSRKALALVIYLALNPGRRSRDELADLLWSDRSQARAAGNLRVALSDIRRKIGDYLDIDRYSAAINGDIWIDVDEVRNALASGNLELALTLYKGEFLESFFIRGAGRFESWQVIEREKVRLELIDGLSREISSLMKAANSKAAIKYLQHLVSLEPLLESAHRQLMQAYLENGEASLALKQFEICRQILAEELGVTPAEDTVNLFERIAHGQSEATRLPITPHNLPHFTTPFIGRDHQSRELAERLLDRDVRHLSLVGPGGYGKTRLAVRLAKAAADKFPDGVFWIPLQGVDADTGLPSMIADAVGFKQRTAGDSKRALLSYLADRQLLLVLDNFEHLIQASPVITEILEAAGRVKVLTTSRQILNLRGETKCFVAGLTYPSEENMECSRGQLEAYDAIRLFAAAAARSRPSFRPKETDLAAIARICRRLDGMPLAIELAAGWFPILTLSEIEAEILGGFELLESEDRDVEIRHRSLRAVASQSWSLLSEKERQIFMRLCIMKGPFTRHAAQRIAGARMADLLALANKSFLLRDSEGLLHLHEWLRYFGEGELRKTQDHYSNALESFTKYYTTVLAESWWEAWSGEIRALKMEWTNITEALPQAAGQGGDFRLSKALASFKLASIVGASVPDTVGVLARVAAAFEGRTLSQPEKLSFAVCLAESAYLLSSQGSQREATESYAKANELIQDSREGWEQAWVFCLESFSGSSADREGMLGRTRKAVEIFERLGDHYAAVVALNTLTNLAEGKTARSYSERALAIASKHHGTRDIGWALMRLGTYEMLDGDSAKAEEFLIEANSRYASIQYAAGMAYTLEYLAVLAHRRGEYPSARESLEQALVISNRAGWIYDSLRYKKLLAAVAFATNDFETSRRLLLESAEAALAVSRDELLEWLLPPELCRLLDRLGYSRLAVGSIMSVLRDPFPDMLDVRRSELEDHLEELKTRHAPDEIAAWIEWGELVRPVELATAIRDALSGASVRLK